jgi:hypothetical protein
MEGATLTDADFADSHLTNTNLRGARLTSTNFASASINNCDFSAADLRGAFQLSTNSSIFTNTVLPDGTVAGLNLGPAQRLVVHDYSGLRNVQTGVVTPIPIHITNEMSMAPDSSLVISIEDGTWGSTISFDPGVPVSLDGSLVLSIAEGVDPNALIGTSWQLFDCRQFRSKYQLGYWQSLYDRFRHSDVHQSFVSA